MLGDLITKLNKLGNIVRYQTETKLINHSVLEHEARVTKYVLMLARWERNKFGNEVNIEELVSRAIFHDDTEYVGGDWPAGIKKICPEIADVKKKLEEAIFNTNIKPSLPKSFVEDYERYMIHAKDDTIEGKLIKAADYLDTIYECIEEVKLGNSYFLDKLKTVTEDFMSVDLDSVRYFMKFSLRDMGLDLKYFGEKVNDFINSIEFDTAVFENPYLNKKEKRE